jgi:ribose 5-phosphate isomerase
MSDAKRLAGEKAIEYVEDGMVVGVGTGSTVAFFIDALGEEFALIRKGTRLSVLPVTAAQWKILLAMEPK